MTPRQFNEIVQSILIDYKGRKEERHIEFDRVMEKLLIELGYEEGVKLIQSVTRWYA